MCTALEELKLEGRLEGRLEGKQEGIEEGIIANIRTCKNFNISKEDTIQNRSRKRVPLNQNECTADFRIGVPFEQNLHSERLQSQ